MSKSENARVEALIVEKTAEIYASLTLSPLTGSEIQAVVAAVQAKLQAIPTVSVE